MAPTRYFLLGLRPEPTDDSVGPRADHALVVEALAAHRLSFAELDAAPWPVRLVTRCLGPSAGLGLLAARLVRDGDSVTSSGEDVGLWFALFSLLLHRRPTHTMVVHHLGTPPKRLIGRLLRRAGRISRVVTYCPAQVRRTEEVLGLPRQCIELIPFQVDGEYFRAPRDIGGTEPEILAIGREARDFETLFAAVSDLPVRVTITAHSPWRSAPAPSDLPANVRLRRPSYSELRDLYASCRAAVVPLLDVDYAAGLNAVVEAMAAGRPVIVARTRGLVHWLRDETNCLLYEPGDAKGLRRCLRRIVDDPELATRIGEAGRRLTERGIALERYPERIRHAVERSERLSPKNGERGVSCPS
ncbi:MAG: glycosyltransferase family 4 protein [Planctomycetota bacterium]